MGIGKINLLIDSDTHQVQHVAAAVRCLCGQLELADAKPSSVELAVVEAVTNSIKHAYRSESGNSVDVAFEYNSECLNIRIKDYGVPMSSSCVGRLASSVSMPHLNVAKNDLPESGWGLELLKTICDEVSYQSLQSSNTLSLSFKLAPVAA